MKAKFSILSIMAVLLSMIVSFGQPPPTPQDDPDKPFPEHGALFVPVEFKELLLTTTKENQPELTWYTASEHNNDYFTIQKSESGTYWEEIATVPGKGTTNIPQKYQFVDYSKITGPLYYKLSQYDYDGRYSQLAVVNTGFNDYSNLYGYQLYGKVQSIHNINYSSTVNLAVVVTDKRVYKIYVPPQY